MVVEMKSSPLTRRQNPLTQTCRHTAPPAQMELLPSPPQDAVRRGTWNALAALHASMALQRLSQAASALLCTGIHMQATIQQDLWCSAAPFWQCGSRRGFRVKKMSCQVEAGARCCRFGYWSTPLLRMPSRIPVASFTALRTSSLSVPVRVWFIAEDHPNVSERHV